MKTMNISEFKRYITDLDNYGGSNEPISIVNGKTKAVIGQFIPENIKPRKHRLGIMNGKVTVTFAPDFKMTTEEFLNS